MATHPLSVEAELVMLHGAGWSADEIIRLARLRGRYERGEVHEETTEYRRLVFEQWLRARGLIDG